MPTLKEDVIEARDRADVARKALAAKLARRIEWSHDEHVEALDGLDSLVSMAQEVLPFLSSDAPGGGGGALRVGADAAPIVPGPDQDMYGTKFTYSGGVIRNGSVFNIGHTAWPVYPALPEGYDADRPNILLDGSRKVWNFSGVDWTGDNAGGTKRECMIEVYIDLPEDQWGDLLVYAHNDGGANHVTAQGKNPGHFAKFEVRGGENQFHALVPVSLSGPPRGGVWDWLQMCIEFVPYEGSKELTIRQGWMKFFLPGTRSSHFRDVNIAMTDGDMQTLSSINEVREHDGFLFFMGDHGYPVRIFNVMQIRGFWFERLHGAKYGYKVSSKGLVTGDADMEFRADELPLAGERFAIVRGNTVEGWLAADCVYSVTPVA